MRHDDGWLTLRYGWLDTHAGDERLQEIPGRLRLAEAEENGCRMNCFIHYILTVIPAKAAIQLLSRFELEVKLDPRLRGGDGSIDNHVSGQR